MVYQKFVYKKNIHHHLRTYFISFFLCVAVFAVGYLLKPALCANSKTCISDLSVSINNNVIGFFQGHKVIPPKVDLKVDLNKNVPESPALSVPTASGAKHIYVDLSTQTLYAYQGETQFMTTLISSGKWGRTPVGNFNIWEKLPVTRMTGGEGADAYDLPNVQWVMYFYNDFGLHGAYWHDNFGHPMSHGCVNMRLIDAKKIYDWADGPTSKRLGTAVSVCNQFKMPRTCTQDQPIN